MLTPSFWNTFSSTRDSMTDEWASHPLSLGSCSRAKAAVGFVAAHMDRAIRISSVCRRGLWFPHVIDFQGLYRLYDYRGDKVDVVMDTAKLLQCIEQQRG